MNSTFSVHVSPDIGKEVTMPFERTPNMNTNKHVASYHNFGPRDF